MEGNVVVEFIIDKTGAVTKAKILKDVGAGCGEEALRVVGLMPKWMPGVQRGRQVSVALRLPVKFKITAATTQTGSNPANPSSAVGPEINLPLTDLKKFYLSPNPNDGHFELRFQLQGKKPTLSYLINMDRRLSVTNTETHQVCLKKTMT
ncbi:MAG: TonB family protein [Haliscomenobacter sp.]|nr:TonB family protein [Haliscomenobacter sp.]